MGTGDFEQVHLNPTALDPVCMTTGDEGLCQGLYSPELASGCEIASGDGVLSDPVHETGCDAVIFVSLERPNLWKAKESLACTQSQYA